MIQTIAIRQRKCKICRGLFTPRSSFQVVCGIPCSLKHGRKMAHKKLRAEKLAGRARLMTRSDHLKKAQATFNRYIRIRDQHLPCISCDRFHEGQWHAGHYRTVKATPELRFDPDNCHRQCQPCNTHLSGNILEYRLGLLKRIGFERVERLDGFHPPCKFTVDDIQMIEKKYSDLAKQLSRETA